MQVATRAEMKSFKEALDSDICSVCGQTPCNCTSVSEAIVPPSERSTMKHRFLVTYSEPHHTMASQRKELKQKHVRVPATDKENKTVYKGEAEPLVKKYMKKQGYKVHNVEHVGLVNEDLRDPKDNPCWTGYKPIGTKKKNGRTVPNCVPTSEGVVESADKLKGTPVVSLSDFGDKDNTKNKYGQTVPKKLKKNDPRVKFHKEPEKKGAPTAADFRAANEEVEVEDNKTGEKKYRVTVDHHGSNKDVPLYTKTYPVRAKSEHEAIGTIRKLVGGRNHRIEHNVDEGVAEEHVSLEEAKPGLWANIHAKRERIKRGSGERMRKPGSKGAPTAQAFIDSAKTSKKVDEVSDKSLTDYLEAHYADKQKPESDPTKRPSFKAKRTELRQHTAMNKLEARPNPHDTQNEEVEQIEELMGTAVKVMRPQEIWKASQEAKKKKTITDLETLAKKVKPVKPIKESHYEDAQEHMSKATESHNQKDIHAYYGYMANYHEALARWHEERGRPNSAEKHAKLADEHHEMGVEQSRKLKEGTSAATRLKGNLKKSGFDMDASAARLKAIEDKYKSQNDAIKKREEQKKVTEQAIQEGIAGLVSNSIKRITAMTPQQKAEIRMNKRKAGNGVNK